MTPYANAFRVAPHIATKHERDIAAAMRGVRAKEAPAPTDLSKGAQQQRASVKRAACEAQILAYLDTFGEITGGRDRAEAFGASEDTLRRCLAKLTAEGVLIRTREAYGGDPARYARAGG